VVAVPRYAVGYMVSPVTRRDTIRWEVGQTARMFIVSETDAARIKTVLQDGGEFDAMLELRRIFRGLSLDQAREGVRTIAEWKPREMPVKPQVRRRSCRSSAE
jgi:hypothetical protein